MLSKLARSSVGASVRVARPSVASLNPRRMNFAETNSRSFSSLDAESVRYSQTASQTIEEEPLQRTAEEGGSASFQSGQPVGGPSLLSRFPPLSTDPEQQSPLELLSEPAELEVPEARLGGAPTIVVDTVSQPVEAYSFLLPQSDEAFFATIARRATKVAGGATSEEGAPHWQAYPMVLQLKAYTKQSFTLMGDTREHRDTLKAIGGRWHKPANSWIFPLAAKDEVLSRLAQIEVELINELDAAEAEGQEPGPPLKMLKLEAAPGGESPDLDKKLMAECPHAGEFIELERKKRVALSIFQGAKLIDIREYYEQVGQMKPGPKGIAMSPQTWFRLMSHTDEIKEAISARKPLMIDLGSNKRVIVSEFKDQWYIGVREYWLQQTTGKWFPGKKGTSLSFQAYLKLIENQQTMRSWLEE